VPDHAKFQIFERVNGGVPLTRQQMRNCLYNGPATVWLSDESKTDVFLDATGRSLDAKKMRDRELINRFCAFFLLGVSSYTNGDMDEFLADALRRMNCMRPGELDALSFEFHQGLKNNFTLFGRHAFRKHSPNASSRSVFNASLWDVTVTTLAHYSEATVAQRVEDIRAAFYPLLKNSTFNDAITYSPNSTNKVHTRFAMAANMFKEALGDYEN
jgi:hypothetical protein